MKRSYLRSVVLGFMGSAIAWGALSLFGLPQFVEQLTRKWNLGGYQLTFLVVLGALSAVYCHAARGRARWFIDAAVGSIVGAAAGVGSIFLSALRSTGIDGIEQGTRDTDIVYPLLLVAVAHFPLASWLFGALAVVAAGVLDRHLLPRLGRILPEADAKPPG